MNNLQKSVLAAFEEGQSEKRCEARCRYRLRKMGLRLKRQRHLWMAICPISESVKFVGPELVDMEAWANG